MATETDTKDEKSAISDAFGKVLRELRMGAGLKQEDLALKAGFHRTYVNEIERGRRNVTLHVFVNLVHALGRDPSKVLKACLLLAKSPAASSS